MLSWSHDLPNMRRFMHSLIDVYTAECGTEVETEGLYELIDSDAMAAFDQLLYELALHRIRVPQEYMDYIHAEVEDSESCGFYDESFEQLLRVQSELDAA